MAEYPNACGASDPVPPGHEEIPSQEEQTVLGDTEVPRGDEAELPCLGVQTGASLLVRQRDDVQGAGAGDLAEEDEDVQGMRGVSGHDASLGATRSAELREVAILSLWQ
jgi:hypothetical protein